MEQRGRRAGFLAALMLTGASAATAQEVAGTHWTLGAALANRTLQETAGGSTLLTERGPVAQLQLTGTRAQPGGAALGLRLSLAGGDLADDGRTSLTPAPFTSTTRHLEGAADLLWRPLAPAAWGEAWLSAGLLANRRIIAGSATVGGLDETSSALLLGGLWRSPLWRSAAGWTAQTEAEGRLSAWHRMDVDFNGLFDATHFTGARRRQLALRLHLAAAQSPWTWTLEWARIAQPESARAPVSKAGAATTFVVYQPSLWTQDVGLRVTRSF